MSQEILILGSKGFIGQSLFRRLSGDGEFTVRGFDLPELDLTDEAQVCSLLPQWTQTGVVIMAAAITRDRDDSAAAMMKNIQMVANLAGVLKDHPPRQLIYLSTVDVYGRRNLKLPLSESSVVQPSNYYGISKITREYVLRLACGSVGTPLTILRLPGVYGPGDTHNSPIRTFITKALAGQTLRVKGNGSELRDFLHIGDLGEVVTHVSRRSIVGTFNVVSGRSCSIGDILKVIERCCGHSLDVSFEGRQEDSDLIFERSAILEHIPAFRFTGIEAGLAQTVDHYRGQPCLV